MAVQRWRHEIHPLIARIEAAERAQNQAEAEPPSVTATESGSQTIPLAPANNTLARPIATVQPRPRPLAEEESRVNNEAVDAAYRAALSPSNFTEEDWAEYLREEEARWAAEVEAQERAVDPDYEPSEAPSNEDAEEEQPDIDRQEETMVTTGPAQESETTMTTATPPASPAPGPSTQSDTANAENSDDDIICLSMSGNPKAIRKVRVHRRATQYHPYRRVRFQGEWMTMVEAVRRSMNEHGVTEPLPHWPEPLRRALAEPETLRDVEDESRSPTPDGYTDEP